MSYLGELLTARREELGKTLEDAARYTSIRGMYLEHLEKGEYEKLPSYVHVHGFLAQYSKYLGLDFAEKVKPLLNDECRKDTFGKTPEEIKAETGAAEKKNDPSPIHAGQVIAVAVLVVIVSVAFIFFKVNGISSKRTAARNVAVERSIYTSYGSGNSSVAQTVVNIPAGGAEQAAAPAEQTPPQTAVATAPAQTAAPSADVPVAGESAKSMILKFSADCWMRYRVDSLDSVGEYTFRGGTEYEMPPFTKFIQLYVGNAGGLTVIYNGKSYSDFGAMSEVVNLYFTVDEAGNLQRSGTPPAL